MKIRDIDSTDQDWISARVAEQFGSSRVVSRGKLHECDSLPGFIAESGGKPVGLLQYDVVGTDLEVVTIIAVPEGKGTGRQLLDHVVTFAESKKCTRCWLVTTNNNTGAIAFYENCGWHLKATHKNAVDEARKIKPEIPVEVNGVPIRDEYEFEFLL